MADTAVAQVKGTVLHVEDRSGIARESGNPYRIRTARVLVEDTGLSEIRLPDTLSPIKGEAVDWLCEFSVYGGRLQGRVLV
jgi:hypothetical protein